MKKMDAYKFGWLSGPRQATLTLSLGAQGKMTWDLPAVEAAWLARMLCRVFEGTDKPFRMDDRVSLVNYQGRGMAWIELKLATPRDYRPARKERPRGAQVALGRPVSHASDS